MDEQDDDQYSPDHAPYCESFGKEPLQGHQMFHPKWIIQNQITDWLRNMLSSEHLYVFFKRKFMIYGRSYLHETLSALTTISLKRSLLPKPVESFQITYMYIAEQNWGQMYFGTNMDHRGIHSNSLFTLLNRQLKSTWMQSPLVESNRIFSPCLSPNPRIYPTMDITAAVWAYDRRLEYLQCMWYDTQYLYMQVTSTHSIIPTICSKHTIYLAIHQVPSSCSNTIHSSWLIQSNSHDMFEQCINVSALMLKLKLPTYNYQ